MKIKKFRLADDKETYGIDAGKFIITSEDGETEITGVVYKEEDADLIVESVNGIGQLITVIKALCAYLGMEPKDREDMNIEELEKEIEKELKELEQ